LPAIVLTGCASAKVQGGNNDVDANQNNGDDANNNQNDAPPPPPPDAPPPPPPDAPPVPISSTLQEPTQTTVTAGNMINCNNFGGGGNSTAENHYYRAYKLTDFGITNDFSLTQVTFGVELATGGPLTATVKVGTISTAVTAATTTLNPANITVLNTTTATINNGATNIAAPITAAIPANATILVELTTPDLTAVNGRAFFPGSNNTGERTPTFFSTPNANCNIAGIRSYANLGFPGTQMVMSVTGTHLP